MLPKKPHRTTWENPSEAPVVLPHVLITVTETGDLNVTVDGTPFPPLPDQSGWTRRDFGALLDAVTEDRTIAVRIEVREADGSVFTDIIRAQPNTPPEPPEPAIKPRRGRHTAKPSPALVEVTAGGFVPGEDIAVAVIVSHTDATGTGSARALLDKGHLADLLHGGAGEVVLLGRVSGTLHVRRLP